MHEIMITSLLALLYKYWISSLKCWALISSFVYICHSIATSMFTVVAWLSGQCFRKFVTDMSVKYTSKWLKLHFYHRIGTSQPFRWRYMFTIVLLKSSWLKGELIFTQRPFFILCTADHIRIYSNGVTLLVWPTSRYVVYVVVKVSF